MSQEENRACRTCSAWHELSGSPLPQRFGYCASYGMRTGQNERCDFWDHVEAKRTLATASKPPLDPLSKTALGAV